MKSLKKILPALFAVLLLLTALSTVSFAAEDDSSVEIVSQNLYYGDTIKIMYAVDAPEGAIVSLKIYSDEACTKLVCEARAGDPDVNYGTNYAVFFGPGVPAHRIDTVLYAKAYADGAESSVKRYSVLEYLYQRLHLGAPSENQKNLYNGLIDYAHKAQAVLIEEEFTAIKSYAYVKVSGGIMPDGYDTGIYSGTTSAKCEITAGNGCYVGCTVNGEEAVMVGGAYSLTLTGGEYYDIAFAEIISNGGIVINGQSVPYYSGEASYYVLNGNKPYFTKDELKAEAWWKYYPLDELGRATGAFACLCQDTVPSDDRDSISHITPSGWVQASYSGVVNSLYNRTHLLAHMFMSDDVHVENFVTGTAHMNQSTMLQFENKVNAAVKNGDYVMYRVTPVYEGNNLVCTGLILEAYSVNDAGEDVEFCVFLYNVQPSVEIDYLTGNSKLGDPTEKHASNTGVVFVVGEGGSSEPIVCEHSYVYTDNEDDKTHTVSCNKCSFSKIEDHTVVSGSCICGYTESAGGESGGEGTESALLATFTLGADGSAAHKDNNSSKTTYSETVNGYTLNITGGTSMYPGSIDATGNGCIKFGTGSKTGSCSFTAPADVTKVIIYVAQYKANATKITVSGTSYDVKTASNDGAYTAIEVDTSTNKTVNFSTATGGVRAMVNTIEFYK